MRYFEDHGDDDEPLGDEAQPGLEAYLRFVAGRKGIMGRGGRERQMLAALANAPAMQAIEGEARRNDLPRPAESVPLSAQAAAGARRPPGPPAASAPAPAAGRIPAFRASPSPEVQRQPSGSGVIGELNRGYREMAPVEPFIEHAHQIGVPDNKQWDTETRVLFTGRDGGVYSRDINPFVEGESPYGKQPVRRARPTPPPPSRSPSPAPSDAVRHEPWRARLPDMIDITLERETGNRDLDDNGRVVTSDQGAQGRMQVMPRTNTNPGYGVRPAQDNSLEERARVGRDYLAALMDRYDGDPERAWAAYNLGPVALNRLISRYGDRWRERLPAETRNYIGANTQVLEALERRRERH